MSIDLTQNPNDAFCIAPWVNIHINQQNQVKPCCGGQGHFESVESYVNGTDSQLITLKQQLVSGEQPAFCVGCCEKEWYSEFLNQELIVKNINDFSIKSIDARWGITCQLSCIYCDAGSSSTWSQLKSKIIPIQSTRMYNDHINKIFELIDANRAQVQRVSMLGGEPLLLKENLRLLDTIHQDTSIEIFTNLNVDIENNEIYQRLISRSNVNWYVSMETIEQRFEFVRRGADWDRQVKNLQHLSQTCPKSISLQSQYCVYNALRLIELYDFANSFNNISVNLTSGVTHPRVLNFFLYPESFKRSALDQIAQCITKYPNSTSHLVSIQHQLENTLQTGQSNIIQECVAWHQVLENKYFKDRFNFLELWPEYLVK